MAEGPALHMHSEDNSRSDIDGSSSDGWGSDDSTVGPPTTPAARSVSLPVRLGCCVFYMAEALLHRQRLPRRTCEVLNAISMLGVIASVCLTVVESFDDMSITFDILDAFFSFFFLMEFAIRLWAATDRYRYLCSCSGYLDICAGLSSMGWILHKSMEARMKYRRMHDNFRILMALRVLRVMRLVKLFKYIPEAQILFSAVAANFRTLRVFVAIVFMSVLFWGSLLWAVEPDEDGFDNIPIAMWWATVTLATVGYGDVVPSTALGRVIACIVIVGGYGLLAVPTLVSVKNVGENGQSDGARSSPEPQRPSATLLDFREDRSETPTRSEYPFFADLQAVYGGAGSISCSSFLDRAVCFFLATRLHSGTSSGPCAIECHCRVLQLMVQPAHISAGIIVEDLQSTSVTFGVGLFLGVSNAPFAVGKVRYSWVDLATSRPMVLPADLRTACESLALVGQPASRVPS